MHPTPVGKLDIKCIRPHFFSTARRGRVRKHVGWALKPKDEPEASEQREPVIPEIVEEGDSIEASMSNLQIDRDEDDEEEEEEDISEMHPSERHAKILIEIANAGEGVDAKITEYQSYIDQGLLDALYKRIETSAKFGKASEMQGLALLWRRLKVEVDRKTSTPAMRLLDELLEIVAPSEDGDDEDEPDRLKEASDYMMDAFLGPQTAQIDIFAVARDLGEGREPPDELLRDPISQEDFVNEVQELLQKVSKGMTEAREQVQSLTSQAKQLQPETDEHKSLMQRADELRLKIEKREAVVKRVDQLLQLAESMSSIAI